MRELLDHSLLHAGADESLARVELRRQIGRLEAELAGLFGEAFGHVEIPHRVGAGPGAPRVLGLGELEEIRDGLASQISEARGTLAERTRLEDANRALLEEMIAAPQRFKWVRVSRADVGEPGCGHWHSRPRLGPIGMLMGWWRVKVSSGCPLAGRLAAVEREAKGKAETEGGSAAEAGCCSGCAGQAG